MKLKNINYKERKRYYINMRTEKEILKDFEKLGYNKFYRNFVNTYIECSINEDIILCIDLENKTFSKYGEPEDILPKTSQCKN